MRHEKDPDRLRLPKLVLTLELVDPLLYCSLDPRRFIDHQVAIVAVSHKRS